MTSRPTALASIVLALALLGDSLLYAVLPLHAATFGVSLTWVGVLLSANRIVRLCAYPLLARMAADGLRRFTIVAAALGGVSTLAFAAASGAWALLASRVAWGVVFGSLSLATLAYATASREEAGRRVGLSLSLRELGPLLSLTLGTAVVAFAGVRLTLGALGLISLAGVFVARHLPEMELRRSSDVTTRFRVMTPFDVLSFLIGFIADGVFPATIGLVIAGASGAGSAVIATGLLLAFKRVAVVVLAPVSGHAADRFGGRSVIACGLAIATAGTLLIAFGNIISGAILLACGAAVISTAIPSTLALLEPETRINALARNAMARDAGAAAGPLAALALFDLAGAAAIYGVAGLLLTGVRFLSAFDEKHGGNTTEAQRRGGSGFMESESGRIASSSR